MLHHVHSCYRKELLLLEVMSISMHYSVTTRSISIIRPSACYNHPPLVCYARTIKHHCTLTRHWLRDCDLKIVGCNMMQHQAHFLQRAIDSKRWVLSLSHFLFRPQLCYLHVGHNLLSEKKAPIIRGIFLVCCLQTSLTQSDTSRTRM